MPPVHLPGQVGMSAVVIVASAISTRHTLVCNKNFYQAIKTKLLNMPPAHLPGRVGMPAVNN